MDQKEKRSVATASPVFIGIVTGQIAGLIMAFVIILVFTLIFGKTFYFPVQVIGSTLFGENALQGFHLGAFLTGLLLHQLGPALLWGTLYGFIAGKLSIESNLNALLLGLFIGVISMVGPYVLIPFVMKTLQGVDIWRREVPLLWDWAAHIVFGATFVFYHKLSK